MVRFLTLVAIKRLTRLVRVDGKASMIVIQQALGMFNPRGTYDSPKLMARLVSIQETADGINKLQSQFRRLRPTSYSCRS